MVNVFNIIWYTDLFPEGLIMVIVSKSVLKKYFLFFIFHFFISNECLEQQNVLRLKLLVVSSVSASFLSSILRSHHFSQKKREFWLRYSEPGYFAVSRDLKFPPTPAHCCPDTKQNIISFHILTGRTRSSPADGIVTTSILTFLGSPVPSEQAGNSLESISR